MKKPTIQRLLSFLLACVLLAQTAMGVAGWHIDFPHPARDAHTTHCAVMEQHHATHHADERDSVGEHHHQCCHTTPGSIAVPANALRLPQVESAMLLTVLTENPYRNPLADLLIRPPIA